MFKVFSSEIRALKVNLFDKKHHKSNQLYIMYWMCYVSYVYSE